MTENKDPQRPIAAREVFFVLILSLVVTLLGLELLARWADRDVLSTHNLILAQLENGPHEFDFDPTLSWIPVKSVSYTSPTWGRGLPFQITLDEYGFRANLNPWRSSINEDFKLLTIGDSFTFGNEVSDDETWEQHLQEILKTKVVNGGVPMFGLDQAELRLEGAVDRIKPALVIVSITPQDLDRTVYTKQIRSITNQAVNKPYFVIEGDGLKAMNQPVPPPTEKTNLGWFREYFGRSHFVNLIARRYAAPWWLSAGPQNSAPPQFKTKDAPAEVSCRILQRIEALGKQKHFVPFVLAQAYWHEEGGTYEADPLVAKVYDCVKKRGWEGVSMEEPLRAIYEKRPMEYDSLFLPWAHMVNRGNLIVAQTLSTEVTNFLKSDRCEERAKEFGAVLPCKTHPAKPLASE